MSRVTSTMAFRSTSSVPTLMSTSTIFSDNDWEKVHYLSLTLWDIDCEFQKSYQAYEKWITENRRKWTIWSCFGNGKLDDELAKVLSLGRRVRELLEKGIEAFGSKFEQGDSTCNTILSAQLLRVQHEIRVPIEDYVSSHTTTKIPNDALLTAAKGVRRACLNALRDQYARLQCTKVTPFLPPPRFSVNICPFAAQLQKDHEKKSFQTAKVRPHDPYDEREICPYCSAHIPVSMHSGLPDYRRLLFQAHLSPTPGNAPFKSTFACTGCYKTFEDSYGFLDHVFQREIGSERSCQKTWSSTQWHWNPFFAESNPKLVEKCLRNCLRRELTRARVMKKTKELESAFRSSIAETEEKSINYDKALPPIPSRPSVRQRPLFTAR